MGTKQKLCVLAAGDCCRSSSSAMPYYRVLKRQHIKLSGLMQEAIYVVFEFERFFPVPPLFSSLRIFQLHLVFRVVLVLSGQRFPNPLPGGSVGEPVYLPLGSHSLISATLLRNQTHTDQGEPGSRLIKGRSAAPGKIPPMSQPSQESSACETAVN